MPTCQSIAALTVTRVLHRHLRLIADGHYQYSVRSWRLARERSTTPQVNPPIRWQVERPGLTYNDEVTDSSLYAADCLVLDNRGHLRPTGGPPHPEEGGTCGMTIASRLA